MRVIKQGYSLPFTEDPPLAFFISNQSASKHQGFVSNEVQRLRETGYIREVVHDEAHIISRLSVADNGDKLRLILELKYLNSFLPVPKLNMKMSSP